MPKPQFRRKDLKPGEVLCEHCTAKCCRYFALPIDTPKTWDDFDSIRWYMTHGRVSLFVDEGTWYLMIHADCRYLLDDHRCGIYEDRPAICRSYTTDECEYDNDALYDKFFEVPEQLWEYAEAVLPPRKQKKYNNGTNLTVELPVLGSV